VVRTAMPVSNAKRLSRGFSLLEMTIAVLIAGIVAAVAVPKYTSTLHRYRTQVAAQRLAQDIDLCRRHARFTSQSVTLYISYTTNFYRVSPLDSPLRPGNPYEVFVGDNPSSPKLRPAYSSIGGEILLVDQASLTIVFDRYGIPNMSAEILIRCGDASASVRLSSEGVVTRS